MRVKSVFAPWKTYYRIAEKYYLGFINILVNKTVFTINGISLSMKHLAANTDYRLKNVLIILTHIWF